MLQCIPGICIDIYTEISSKFSKFSKYYIYSEDIYTYTEISSKFSKFSKSIHIPSYIYTGDTLYRTIKNNKSKRNFLEDFEKIIRARKFWEKKNNKNPPQAEFFLGNNKNRIRQPAAGENFLKIKKTWQDSCQIFWK